MEAISIMSLPRGIVCTKLQWPRAPSIIPCSKLVALGWSSRQIPGLGVCVKQQDSSVFSTYTNAFISLPSPYLTVYPPHRSRFLV